MTTRAWLSLAHSTCSATQAYNYTTCLSNRRSPQVMRCVCVCLCPTVGAVWHCSLFTQPWNSLFIVSCIYSAIQGPSFCYPCFFSNCKLYFPSVEKPLSHSYFSPSPSYHDWTLPRDEIQEEAPRSALHYVTKYGMSAYKFQATERQISQHFYRVTTNPILRTQPLKITTFFIPFISFSFPLCLITRPLTTSEAWPNSSEACWENRHWYMRGSIPPSCCSWFQVSWRCWRSCVPVIG